METNKLCILDLDGVLIDSRELHFDALNDALKKIGDQYVIDHNEHLSFYDGLSTTTKLKMLTEHKGLDQKYYDQIWYDKQLATFDLIKQFPNDNKLIEMIKELKSNGIKVAVASNSIRETVKLALLSIGIMPYIDYYVSNEDVKRPKPFPEMYWKCMVALNSLPKDTFIIEDSHIGRQAALDSGAYLLPVEDSYDFCSDATKQKIYDMLHIINTNVVKSVSWRSNKLNVLIPMAGLGSRFSVAGYTFPKPLIEVHGKPMIQVVVENLNIDANYIFIVQQEHYNKYNLKYLLNLIAPNCTIVLIDGLTEGAACTTLLAKEYINNSDSLLIANSDQFLEWNSNECMYAFSADSIDGGILTFTPASHPKWSYSKLDENGFVSEVAEKQVISQYGNTGIYYWKHGSDYVKYTEQMINNTSNRVNNEWYVAPVYNEAIKDNKKIRIKNVEKMWGLGDPESLVNFITNYKGVV